jgi:hypothetical protein
LHCIAGCVTVASCGSLLFASFHPQLSLSLIPDRESSFSLTPNCTSHLHLRIHLHLTPTLIQVDTRISPPTILYHFKQQFVHRGRELATMSNKDNLPNMDPFSPAHQPDEGYSEDPLNPSVHVDLPAALAHLTSHGDLLTWLSTNANLLSLKTRTGALLLALQLPRQ